MGFLFRALTYFYPWWVKYLALGTGLVLTSIFFFGRLVIPPIMIKLLKKIDFFISCSSMRHISFLSFRVGKDPQSKTPSSGSIAETTWIRIKNMKLGIKMTEKGKRLVLSIEDLKVRLDMQYIKFDVIMNNVLGRDKNALPGIIAVNIDIISKLFLEYYTQIKLGNLVKTKRSQSSFEKLNKVMKAKDILVSLIVKLVQMFLFKLVALEIGKMSLEFDDSQDSPKSDRQATDLGNQNSQESGDLKVPTWTNQDEMREKYSEIWKKHGNGVDAIEQRYFNDQLRKRIACLDFEDIKIQLNFNQSEKYLVLVKADRGYIYVYSKNSSTIFTANEIKNPFNKRLGTTVTSQSPFLAVMARGIVFKYKFPMNMNSTLSYIHSQIRFYLHESQFFTNKKSLELFFSFMWNIKLLNNIKGFAKKTKLKQIKDDPGFNYLVDKEKQMEQVFKKEIEKQMIWRQKVDALDNVGLIKPQLITDIYKFIEEYYPKNADYVRPDLVPAIPGKMQFWFRKSRWIVDLPAYEETILTGIPQDRLKNMRCIIEMDNFDIDFHTKRLGKMLKCKSYSQNFEIKYDRFVSYYEPLSHEMQAFDMSRNIQEELDEIEKHEKKIHSVQPPPELKPGQTPLAYLSNLLFQYKAETTKNPEKVHHDKIIWQNFSLQDYSFCYSPKLLNLFKSMLWMQIIFNNYNFATYKSYLQQIIKAINEGKTTEDFFPKTDRYDPRLAKDRLDKLPEVQHMKIIEDLIREQDKILRTKKIDMKVIIGAIQLYLERQQEKDARLLNFKRDMKAQEENFKPERGLYQIQQIRKWNLGVGFFQIYSVDNKPLLGIQISDMDYDNNEMYPYLTYWLRHRKISQISLYDIRVPTGQAFRPSYMLSPERQTLIGTIKGFSKKIYMSGGEDEDDLSLDDVDFQLGPDIIQEIIPSIMQLVKQVQRLTFNKSKFRSRRTMMEENLRAKKSFIQSYHIGKITIEIQDNAEKAAQGNEARNLTNTLKQSLGISKKPEFDQKIQLIIHGLKKDRETVVKDTVGVIKIGSIKMLTYKSKKSDDSFGNSLNYWQGGKKFKDSLESAELGSQDVCQILTLGKIVIKRNTDFLLKMLNKTKKEGSQMNVYDVLQIGDMDQLVAKLIQKSYMIVNFESLVVDVPFDVEKYSGFLKTIQNAVADGLKINKSLSQPVETQQTASERQSQANLGSQDKLPLSARKPRELSDIIKFLETKVFVTITNLNILVENNLLEQQLMRKHKFIRSYLAKNEKHDFYEMYYRLKKLRTYKPTLLSLQVKEFSLDFKDCFSKNEDFLSHAQKLNDLEWVSQFKKILQRCDPWAGCVDIEKDFSSVSGQQWKALVYGIKIGLLDYGGYTSSNSNIDILKQRIYDFTKDKLVVDNTGGFLDLGVQKMAKLIMSTAKLDTEKLMKEELPWDQDEGLDFMKIKFLGLEGVMVNATLEDERFICEKNQHSGQFSQATLNAVKSFGCNKVYLDSEIFLDELQLSAGLNWTFGFRLVQKWLGKITSIKSGSSSKRVAESPTKELGTHQKPQGVGQSIGRTSLSNLMDVTPGLMQKQSHIQKLHEIERVSQHLQISQINQGDIRDSLASLKNVGSLSLEEEVRSWDKIRFKFHTKIKLKLQNFGIKLLTGISPYDKDNLQMVTKLFYVDASNAEVKLLIEDLFLRCQSSMSSKHKKKSNNSQEEMQKDPNEFMKFTGENGKANLPKMSKNKVVPQAEQSSKKMGSFSPSKKSTAPKQTINRNLLDSDSIEEDDEEIGFKNIYYEPLLKLPRLELLVNWDWNPKNDRFNHYFAFSHALGDKAPLEYIARNLRLEFALNIPKHDGGIKTTVESAISENANKKRNLVEDSPVPILNYQSELFAILVQLPQLSTDFLRLVGINIFKYSEKNEDDSKEQAAELKKKQLAICSNYLDLVAYQLNEKLNDKSKDNLLKFISEVGLKVTACSIRLVCSNKEDPKIAKLKRENKRTKVFRLIGIQIALDSIIIQSIFHKKDLRVSAKRLGTISKGITQRWAAKDAFARTHQIYASFFDGVHLIPMDPHQFQKERLENWEDNIQNPKMFQKFFGLKKGFETTQQIINQETKALGSNHLFKFDYYKDFVPAYLKQKKQKANKKEEILAKFDAEESAGFDSFEKSFKELSSSDSDDTSESDFGIDSRDENVTKFDSKKPKNFFYPSGEKEGLFEIQKTSKIGRRIDLDQENRTDQKSSDFIFSPVGVIFKADSLCYRKYKKYKIKNSKQETTRQFNHFLTIKGCKLLISQWLKPIITYVFEEPFFNIRERNKLNAQRMKKESEQRKHLSSGRVEANQQIENQNARNEEGDESLEDEHPQREGQEDQNHLLFLEDTSNKIRNSYALGIKVEKPEFNINDYENKCQILFASHKECFITVCQEFLEYDFFEQDCKKTIKCGFSDLQLFTVPPNINTGNKIFWLEDTLVEHKLQCKDSKGTEQVADNVDENTHIKKGENNLGKSAYRSEIFEEDLSFDLSDASLNEIDQKIKASKKKTSGDIKKQTTKMLESLPKNVDDIHGLVRKGILSRIIFCDRAMIRMISFQNAKSIIDFSKPITTENVRQMEKSQARQASWNGRTRTNRFIVNIGEFSSIMSAQDFEIFFVINDFLMEMFGQNQNQKIQKQNNDQKNAMMLAEIKEHGIDNFRKYLDVKIEEMDKKKKSLSSSWSEKSAFEYTFDNIELQMTEGEKVFLGLKISEFHGKHTSSSDGHNDFSVGVKNIEMKNMVTTKSKHSNALKRLAHQQNRQEQAILVNQSHFIVPGQNPQNRWKIVSNYEIMITPLRLDITEEIYEKLNNYIFRKETERMQKKQDEDQEVQQLYLTNPDLYFKVREMNLKKHKQLHKMEQQKDKMRNKNEMIQEAPNFYRRIRFSEMRLVVTFRSNSLFMNCDRMMVSFMPFEKSDKMYTSKQMIDKFLKFCIKQTIKSIVKNKIFFIKARQDTDEDEEESQKNLEKKKKMLLGYQNCLILIPLLFQGNGKVRQ